MPHNFEFAAGHGEDAPGSCPDTYSHCSRCGAVKHDYRHGGGQTSPNYPMFLVAGKRGWQATEPECAPPAFKANDITTCPECGGSGGGDDPALRCSHCGGSGWNPL